MARMSAWERTQQGRIAAENAKKVAAAKKAAEDAKKVAAAKAAAAKASAVKPAIKPMIKPAAKPSQADALAAIAMQGEAEKRRADLIKNMKNLKPYNGKVLIAGKTYPIKGGNLTFGGVGYQVSKDGRAVINRDLLLVGEIRGGVLNKPTKEFLNEMKAFGEAY